MRWAYVLFVVVLLILVPFLLFEGIFSRLAAQVVSSEAPAWTVFLGASGLLALDVVLPIPSSLVSTAAGAFLGFWPGALAVWTGMTLSCAIGYYIGAKSMQQARRVVGDDGLTRAAFLSERYGTLALVLCRPVPVLAEASVIVAGLTKAPVRRSMGACALSNIGVAAGYAAVGAFSMRMDSFLLAFAGSLALPGLALLVARVSLRKR